MRIAFVHHPGRVARLAAARVGEAPTEFLFGAIELERAGHEIRHFEIDPRGGVNRVARRAIDGSAGRGHLPPHLAAASLRETYRLRRELGSCDVVVASTTGTAMSLATWRAVGLLRRPLIGIVAGLVNNPWSRMRARTTRSLLARMHAVLYGEGELEPLLARAPELEDRVHVNPFGVDTGFWTPGDGEPSERDPGEDVLAIGSDGHRDWETLIRAAPGIPAPVRVLTGAQQPVELPANVTWTRAGWHEQVLSDEEVRELYRTAAVVVVPIADVPQPSGQSVTLQAMACARPVVLSRTRGLWSPNELEDGANVAFVPPRDSAALTSAVRGLLDDADTARRLGRAARAWALRRARVTSYAERLLEICERALERP
jgi:glycosyltransferase involved in cell wall biosynthesis